MKTLSILGAGLMACCFTTFGQGTIQVVNNTVATRITNCVSGLPQPRDTMKLGVYFTPDLSAVSNAAARAGMMLAAVCTNRLDGYFSAGMVVLPGVPIGLSVVLQIKAWPVNYASYEQAVAAGADVAESLPWVQPTGGSIFPPTVIHRWGFRPFLFPQCRPLQVPLFVERDGTKVRVNWPVGFPPTVQMNDGSSTNWVPLTSGTFVNDHWEFEVEPTAGVRLFRLGQ
jgi:hypothetical protein